MSYNDAHAFIVCFSLNDDQSLEAVDKKWLPELKRLAPPHTPVVLCGTKLDLRTEIIENNEDSYKIVTTEQGEEFCMKHRLIEFVETSAKEF